MRALPVVVVVGLALTAVVPVVATAPQPLVFPNIELHSLRDGSTVQLDSLKGRPVLLTFWATWCGPCRIEMPEIQKIYNDLGKRGFTVAAVNLDKNPELAQRFVSQMGITLPVYRVDPITEQRIGVTSLPTSILLDPTGVPAQLYEGYDPRVVKDIRRRVEGMLEAQSGGPQGAAAARGGGAPAHNQG